MMDMSSGEVVSYNSSSTMLYRVYCNAAWKSPSDVPDEEPVKRVLYGGQIRTTSLK